MKWQPWDAKQEKQKIWHLLLPLGATVLGYWTLCFQVNLFNCIYWESDTVRSWSPHWWCGKGDDDDDDGGFYTALFSGWQTFADGRAPSWERCWWRSGYGSAQCATRSLGPTGLGSTATAERCSADPVNNKTAVSTCVVFQHSTEPVNTKNATSTCVVVFSSWTSCHVLFLGIQLTMWIARMSQALFWV